MVIIGATEYFLSLKNKKGSFIRGVTRAITLREHPAGQKRYIVPDNKYMEGTDSLEQKEYRFFIDQDGFIEPTNSDIYSKPDLKIAFLGGSTTECIYVDEEIRYPYMVSKLLEKKNGLKVVVYNGGVSGNNSIHSNNILLNKVIPKKSNIVILQHNINDLNLFLFEKTYWNNNPNKVLVYTLKDKELSLYITLRGIKDALIPNLYSKIRIYFHIGALLKGKEDEWAEIRGKKIKIDEVRILSDFQKSLQTFVCICKTYHMIPVLITQASRLKDHPDQLIAKTTAKLKEDYGIEYSDYKKLHDNMNQKIRDVAKENNILLIDLEQLVPKENKYIYDSVHYNNFGSKFVARIIADKLSVEINKAM